MQQLKHLTQRLELVALYPKLARAAVNDRSGLAKLLNAKVPDEFPPEIMADVMELFAQTLEANPGKSGWWGWYVVLNELEKERVLIGCAGFNGYPDTEGKLLLGYSVLDDYQGKGYTTEAVGGLLSWAFEQPQVMSVIAETFPNHAASIRVMEKNGMVLLGNGSEEGTVRYGIVRS
ncbi:MAG: GNAT family N-acetyltransferase [Stigonema ocellatum SAG 48.90 = DSM 106950]|nr:GNAT family N-acetyltransferase [Stigonema ocellatum SAG 48.90 = DSM 106950]